MSKFKPDLQDTINELVGRLEALEDNEYSFGDPESDVNDSLIITDLSGVVSYYSESITNVPKSKIVWSWSAPAVLDDDDLSNDPIATYMFSASPIANVDPITFTSTKGETTIVVDGLPLSTDIVGSVYAVTRSGLVGPTATTTQAVSKDTTPPPVPSAPILTAAMRGVVARYDGKDNTAANMPSDFFRVGMHVSTVTGFTADSTNFYLFLGPAESVFITADASYSPIYVKFIAYDYSANASAASAQATATPIKVISTDLGVVLPGNIAFTDVDNLLVDGSFENTLLTTERLTFSKVGTWATNTDEYHGTNALSCVGSGTTPKYLWLNSTSSAQLGEFSTDAGKLYFAMRVKGLASANGTISIYVQWRSQTDVLTYSTAVSKNTASSGSYELLEGVVAVPVGTKSVSVSLRCENFTTGTWLFDAITCKAVVRSILIEDAAITNAKIANLAVDDAKIASLAVGKLTAGEIQAGARIIAGPTGGTHAEMHSAGFSTYVLNPDTAALVEVTRLGVAGQDDAFYVKNADGDTVAGIDNSGNATFAGISIPSLTGTSELNIYGTEFTEWLNSRAKGIVAWIQESSNSSNATTTEVAYKELRCILEADRMYKIVVPAHLVDADTAGSDTETRLRVAYDGTSVTTSSTQIGMGRRHADDTTSSTVPGVTSIINTAGQATPTREARFLYSVIRVSGSGNVWIDSSVSQIFTMLVEDAGPSLAQAAAITEYTSVWEASATEAYDGTGTARTDATYLGYSNAPISVGGCVGGSNNYSLALFNNNAISGETASTIATALSGATIVDAWLYVYAQYTEDASGLDVAIRTNTLTSIANTTPTGTAVNKTNLAEGSGSWVKITSILTNASRGIWYGPGATTGDAYHGHIRSEASPSGRPQLKIKYRR